MKKALRPLLLGAVVLLGLAPPAVGRAETLKDAGTVTAVAGPVTVVRLSGPPQPLRFRDSLFWRDVVEARKDGIARVLIGGKTTVTVRELSRLELREEVMAEGIRYTAELVSGKVRASVARMLMRPGDQVEVRTKNAVASVRGTDFIVETIELPPPARAFGLLGVREVAQVVADNRSQAGETIVVTLSGEVEVANRLAGTGRAERVRAYEAVRVSGRQDPVRLQLGVNDLRVLLQGLTPPRPQEARSGDKSEAVGNKVERVALTTSAQSVRVYDHAGGDGGSRRPAQQDGQSNGQSGDQNSQNAQSSVPGGGQANAPAVGQSENAPSTPAVPATPATPAVAATPATPATPPAAAVSATPATPPAPAVTATPAVPAAAAASAKPGLGQAVGKPAVPPGQAKK